MNNSDYRRRLYNTVRAFYRAFDYSKEKNRVWFACAKLHDVKNMNQISLFISRIKKYCDRNNIKLYGYEWVLEQQGKYPHYHVVFAISKGRKLPFPDKKYWTYGSSNLVYKLHIGYKYLAKAWKNTPNKTGVRKFGVGALKDNLLYLFKTWKLPEFVRKYSFLFGDVVKVRFGWWYRKANKMARYKFNYVNGRFFPEWEIIDLKKSYLKI